MSVEKKVIKIRGLYGLVGMMKSINRRDPRWNVDWENIGITDSSEIAEVTIYKEFEGSLNDDKIIDCPICQGLGYLDREQERVCDLCDGDLKVTTIEYTAYLEMLNSEEV